MAIEISESNKKIRMIADQIRHYGILIGRVDPDNYVPHLPCTPGLGMVTEAECFLNKAKDIQKGLFKILVMGKFKNGKSTFINAMLGRNLMAAKATATTAVIAVVEYGTHKEYVRVYYNDSERTEEISLEEFHDEFALNEEDQVRILEEGVCDRFSEISHVEMESDEDLFKDGVQLIDSPGLEEANSRTKTTNLYVPQANAIIFMLNAASLFSGNERKYIAQNFAGKQLRNVFFVVNRTDNLGPGQLEATVKPSVYEGLRGVFTRWDGAFDEELYKTRVFYTNAYGALCARTDEPYRLTIGDKTFEVKVDIADTGMHEFEAALNEFLNSEERMKATFQSTLVSMANAYMDAESLIIREDAARALPLEKLEGNIRASEEILRELKNDAERMRHLIKHQGEIIAKKVYMSLYSFVQTEIPREFAAAIENSETKFGIKDMLKLAESALTSNLPWRNGQETGAVQEKILKPITDRINAYIYDQLELWQKNVVLEVESEVRDLEAELGEEIHRFDLKMQQAVDVFAAGNVKSVNSNTANALQTVIALTHGDISLAVEGAALGGMSWSEYFRKTFMQAVINWMIGALFGSTILVPAMIVEIGGIILSSQRLPKKLLSQIGPIAFQNLKERVAGEELNLIENVQKQFYDQSDDLFQKANSLIADEEHRQAKILEEKRSTDSANQSESGRQKAILNSMHCIFSNVYKELYGVIPEETDIQDLAAKKEVNYGV